MCVASLSGLCHTAQRSRLMSLERAICTVSAARGCCALVLLLFFSLLPPSASAQRGGLNDPRPLQDFSTSYNTAPGTGVLVFTVYGERSSSHLDRQALLKLVNLANQTATWQ